MPNDRLPRYVLAVALVVASASWTGCDSQESEDLQLSAEVVGGDAVGGQYLAGARIAVEFTNRSGRTLAYDICSTWLESEADGLQLWGAVCAFAPQLREVGAGETVVDSLGISGRAPTGRYRYVFRTYTSEWDSLANATTGVFDVVAAP